MVGELSAGNVASERRYEVGAWDLGGLGVSNINELLEDLNRRAASIESQRPQLSNDTPTELFLSLLGEFEELRAHSSRLGCFVSLRLAEDSSNPTYQAEHARVSNALTKIGNRLLFFSLWFKELPDDRAAHLIAGSGKFHYFLEELRKTRPYTLKEEQEALINTKDVNGIGALVKVYDTLTSQFEYDFDGETINQPKLLTYVRHEDPAKREQAYRVLFGKYVHYRDVLGQIYRSVVDDWREENVGIRKYREPIQVRNIANDIPDQAVDTLLEVCEKHHHLFHRFFEVKKKRLNLATFSRFDLYAPVKPGDEEIDYDQGMRMVLESFREFAPEFEQFTRQLIDANHIHSRCQKNKRGGAFCSYTGARMMPYVLLNYAGKTRDVSTLAHELGHAIHGMLAREQTEMTYVASLPMAETASIFAEMLLSEKLMARYPERAAEMSFQKLEDIYASVVRQAGFVAFEKKAHRMLEGGATVEEISQVYIDDLRRQLGDKLPVDEVFRHEWSYIPHIFHTPFYCYAYAFGNLLTLGLYQLYKENGASFGPKIISMLARGGSDSPQNLAQSLGIDLCSAAFWEKCFKQVEVMVDRVQELA